MPEQIENRMVMDSQWDELESYQFGIRRDGLYKRQRKAYEEEERERGKNHGK
jgi:hypothetical protein